MWLNAFSWQNIFLFWPGAQLAISLFLTRYAVNTGWWDSDIHGCYSLMKIAFAPICACKNDRRIHDVTMLVSYIRVTSQINCGDVTILNQKRLSLATTAKSAIDNCFGGISSTQVKWFTPFTARGAAVEEGIFAMNIVKKSTHECSYE